LFLVVSVGVFVNTKTPEPLEISSRNFHGIILYGQRASSMAIVTPNVRWAGGGENVSDVLVALKERSQVKIKLAIKHKTSPARLCTTVAALISR